MVGLFYLRGNLKLIEKEKLSDKNSMLQSLKYNDIYILRETSNKFIEDKYFYEDNDYIFIIEGIILNKEELVEKYKEKNFIKLIINLYKNKEKYFFREFRGSYSGIFIDKKKEIHYIFTDHIGDRKLYYYIQNNKIIVSSTMNYLINTLKFNKLDFKLNRLGVYTFLTYGNMLENYTLIDEINRLIAGQVIEINKNKIEVKYYHKITKKNLKEKTEEEIIDRIDFLFNKALKRQVEKNKKYNYLNLAPLSAGYDSRMTNFVLKKYSSNIINITYSENGYYDEKIPKKISSDLKNHWIFKSLNNGVSYNYFEKVQDISEGFIYSSALCQLVDVYEKLNLAQVGIIHTGIFGECLAGVECDLEKLPYRSIKVKNKFESLYEKIKKENYGDKEIENYYNGSFICEHYGTPKFFQNLTESFSPFYDIDFIEYCISIPNEIRREHNIYEKWILKKYPLAAKYKINGKKICKKYIKIFNKKITIDKIINFIKKKYYNKLGDKIYFGMNPIDLWFEKNKEIEAYFNELFQKNILSLKNEKEIYEDCKKIYLTGNVLEKDIVLTFLLNYTKFFK